MFFQICFLGSWFSLKILSNAATYVGDEFIGFMKTNTKEFCKDAINNMKSIVQEVLSR